ncbi:MAG: arsenate reductase family protein [Lachnospiraceae bacterium]|nr:arsenate reductase family protein [Lachnospiraceae bacterium]
MLFLCYPKCTTCKKAEKWLKENHLEYETRNIKEENPRFEELKEWYERSGLDIKKFFNTSGNLYKEQELKDKLPSMSDEDKLRLLATNGMLVKRPVLITEEIVLVGFKEEHWRSCLIK